MKKRTRPAGVVHGLWYGQPLCGFQGRNPSEWPQGHTFVMATELEHISCDGCKREADRIARGERC